jgi:hypothetical protein
LSIVARGKSQHRNSDGSHPTPILATPTSIRRQLRILSAEIPGSGMLARTLRLFMRHADIRLNMQTYDDSDYAEMDQDVKL